MASQIYIATGRISSQMFSFVADVVRPSTRYDGKIIRDYWDKKPLELQSRWTYFLGIVVPFGTKLFRNLTLGTAEKNAAELASDFRKVLEKLGPTFVKLGQVSCANCG